MRNIYLVGMMGSGKSETAKALARLLGMKSVDLDELIVQTEKQTINEIFERKGEPYFREVESRVLAEVSIHKNQVVATGGGTVLAEKNRKVLLQTGKIIYLKAGLGTLLARVQSKKDRPLLKSQDPLVVLERIFIERKPLYESFEEQIETDGKTPVEVAREIADMLETSEF